MQTYPTFENVLFEFMYVLDVMYVPRKLPASWTKLTEIDDVSLLVLRKKQETLSEILLYPVWVVSLYAVFLISGSR